MNPSATEALKTIEGEEIERAEGGDCFFLGNVLEEDSKLGRENLEKN